MLLFSFGFGDVIGAGTVGRGVAVMLFACYVFILLVLSAICRCFVLCEGAIVFAFLFVLRLFAMLVVVVAVVVVVVCFPRL